MASCTTFLGTKHESQKDLNPSTNEKMHLKIKICLNNRVEFQEKRTQAVEDRAVLHPPPEILHSTNAVFDI